MHAARHAPRVRGDLLERPPWLLGRRGVNRHAVTLPRRRLRLRAPKPRSAPLAVRCATDAAAVAHECNRVRAAARRLRCALKPVTAAIVSPTLTARASVLRTAHLMNCAHLVRRPALAHDGFRCSGALSSLIRGRHCVRGSSGRRPAAQAPSALGATDVRVLDAHARRGRARPSDARRV